MIFFQLFVKKSFLINSLNMYILYSKVLLSTITASNFLFNVT